MNNKKYQIHAQHNSITHILQRLNTMIDLKETEERQEKKYQTVRLYLVFVVLNMADSVFNDFGLLFSNPDTHFTKAYIINIDMHSSNRFYKIIHVLFCLIKKK